MTMPQPQYPQPVPNQPSRVVSKRKMGIIMHCVHITLTICTAGLWGFVYWSRLRARKTVTHYR
jgi:hypothetical protein